MDVLFYLIAAIIVAWSVFCLVRAFKNSKKGCGCSGGGRGGCSGCGADCTRRGKKN
ncbi:MAG: FeoB-associated Cys-rich membrane protein [Clostridiaceae bacterium]